MDIGGGPQFLQFPIMIGEEMKETARSNQVCTFSLEKDLIGSEVQIFKEKIRDIIEKGQKRIQIDFKNLKQIDSSGIGALISLRGMLNKPDSRLTLVNVSKDVISILKTVRLDILFDIHEISR